MYHPLLDWASHSPWLAAFLSVPTAAVLCTVAWAFASAVTTVANTFFTVVHSVFALLVYLVHGFPPSRTEELPKTEDKPFAS